jgi:hypothetical protein
MHPVGPQGGGPGGGRGGVPSARFLVRGYPGGCTTRDPCQMQWGGAPLPMVCERRGAPTTVIGNTPLHPQKRTPTPHTFGPLSLFVFSFFLALRRERRRAAVHSARDPHSTLDSKSVHTGAPCDICYALVAGLRDLRRQCQHNNTVMHTSRKKQRRWTLQHMIEIPAACAHCSCCNITFRRPESFCAKAAELEHTNMHRQRVHAHRLCLRTLF